jgi:hypothetical protein
MSDMLQSLVQEKIQEASQLPLVDAAYILWANRHYLDDYERSMSLTGLAKTTNDPKGVSNEELHRRIRFEIDNAEHGPTFHRLKGIHPTASEQDIRYAIRMAVTLDEGSKNKFSYSAERSLFEDIRLAIEAAKREHPDFKFLDSTYKRLEYNMFVALR